MKAFDEGFSKGFNGGYDEGFNKGRKTRTFGDKFTCQQLIRWSTDVFGYEFAKDIYDKTVEDWHSDGYVAGKFKHMQRDIVGWMANLDAQHQEKLARSIIGHSDEDGSIREDSPLNWGKK
jgi:hypothetical protein